MKTLKAVFDFHFQDVKFDNAFVENVDEFVRRFLTKNNDHVDFFGGNLLGVHTVRWNYSDTDTWWDEIFDVVPEYVQKDLFKLPDIKTDRVISSDVLNHALIYSIHRVHHSPEIKESQKELTKTKLMLVLNMKFLCSLMAHYFKYPADPGIAEKTFNCLSNRYDIKTLGSWGRMLNKRSAEFVEPGARYYKSYVEYRPDVEIVKMLNDAQGRIRETVKSITAVYYENLKANMKVLSSSSSVELDGKIVLKDVVRKASVFNRYIKTVISNGDAYIKPELTQVVYAAIPSLQPEMYDKLQAAFIKEYHNKKYNRHFEAMIDSVLTYSFDVLKNANISERDLPGLVYRLKHVYMSGRVQDPLLLKARKEFEKLIDAVDKKLRNTPLVPERCGVFLYLVLRTLTMNTYK